MQFFINKYPEKSTSSFHRLNTNLPIQEIMVTGQEENNGLLAQAKGNGQMRWTKRYSIKGSVIAISHCEDTPDNGYMLLGRIMTSKKKRVEHLLIRVDLEGNPLWARRIHTRQTRSSVALERIGKDEYAITGWKNIKGSQDRIELIKVDGDGRTKAAKELEIGSDTQVLAMTALHNELVLVGGTNAGRPWSGFLIRTDFELRRSFIHLFNHPVKDSVEDIQAIHYQGHRLDVQRRILLLGRSRQGRYYRSFLAIAQIIKGEQMLVEAISFDITKGADNSRRVLEVDGRIYTLGQDQKNSFAFVCCFDGKLDLIWAKKIDLEESYVLADMQVKEGGALWFSGYTLKPNNRREPLLIKTDLELTTCKTTLIRDVEVTHFPLEIEEISRKLQDIKVVNKEVEIQASEHRLQVQELCPTKVIEIDKTAWLQSPYLYLQSAGSMGVDASEGILLRWFLLRNLGATHIPKGTLANSSNGFNKQNDFVCIYRADYRLVSIAIDFANQLPIFIDHYEYRWVYRHGDLVLYLHFLEQERYNELRTQLDPNNNPREFLNLYGDGLLELEIQEELAFSMTIAPTGNADGRIQVEYFSTQGNLSLAETDITARKTIWVGDDSNWRTETENLKKVQFKTYDCMVDKITLELYNNTFMEITSHQGWVPLGRFALSENQAEVFDRLEDSNRFQVDGHWQKYNDDAFVNAENYRTRWTQDNGLAHGVRKYITLSETDPSATELIEEEVDGEASMEVSFFDLLQLASMDYHVARMLGLGHIDTPRNESGHKYIYLAEYYTYGQLDHENRPRQHQHLYMTLPTSRQDERMPQLVETLSVTYGLELYNGNNSPIQLTDANGYVPYEPIRYINVRATLHKDYGERTVFFQPNWEFESATSSSPVFGGLEYRMQGESNWRKPEISHDPDYVDASSNNHPETVALPFHNDTNAPLYIHDEREEGIHEYAAYSINIFSRASAIHNSVFTDFTKFVKSNTLLPPHNLSVQLIQEENPRLLTTANEQLMLEALSSSPDKTLVRITFNYTHLHDINYQFGNVVEIFFRDHLPRHIEGGINTVSDNSNEQLVIVTTRPYTFNSTGETVTPNIPSSQFSNFIGGVLVVGEGRYVIEDIIATSPNGDLPKFKVRKRIDRNTIDLGGGNLVTNQIYVSPNASSGDLFMAIENMASAQSWGSNNPLAFSIDIGDSSWTTRTEVIEDEDAGVLEREIRGVWDDATITPIPDPNTNNIDGYYEVAFNNYQLGHHPQHLSPSNIGDNVVDWYKGILRVATIADTSGNQERKVLEVVEIVNIGDGQPLRLMVHDESFTTDTDSSSQNIQTGTNISVNFYPGYRAYIHADSPHSFDKSTILPATGEGSKSTILGLRTLDTTTVDANNEDYHSKVGIPQILYALEIINPQPPKLPSGPAYATPPDFYSKSTYTFSTAFNHVPFGAIFYRADVNAVLKALYKKETYDDIISSLPSPDQDEFYSDRIQSILTIDFDELDRTFTKFPLSDNGDYGFPEPDNPDNGFSANPTGDQDIDSLIKSAIYGAFIPLTEQPLIYSAIKGGDYVPIPKKQTIRDKYGKLLNPSDPEYDLAPMAKKLSNNSAIRFTDFTLDGEMSTHTAYLYCVRELGNRMSLSDPSPILGPIQLVNTNPPESPVVRKFTTQLEDPITGALPAINFQINEYSKSQNIKKVRIYRAIKAVDALSPRTMVLAKDIILAPELVTEGIIHIQDDFSDMEVLPYGEALFYRIVALREVLYERDGEQVIEYVPSKPTKTLLTNIVDVNNPAPPKVEQVAGDLIDEEIVGLSLKWNKTAHNATYYLFKMNSVGNWNKLTEIRSNEEADLVYTFSDPVPKTDEDDDTIYHRFKVSVENSSGLLNIAEDILTL